MSILNRKASHQAEVIHFSKHGFWEKTLRWIGHFQHVFWIICIILSLILLSSIFPAILWEKLWLGIKAQRFLLAMALLFLFLALSLVWSVGQRIDEWIFIHFNSIGKRAKWLDKLMLTSTQLGNFIFALLVTLLLFLIGRRLLGYELILGVLTLGLIVQTMKVLIHRTRPYNKVKQLRIVGKRDAGHSFPSGHTSQAFFMAALLLQDFHANVLYRFLFYTIALFVGITRIYVGMHYPRDVIAGAILGTSWGHIWVTVNVYIVTYLGIVY